jgi:ornithine cyclodeaminase
MGADAVGKQELDLALVASARLFSDLPEQSADIGEFQYAIRAGCANVGSIRAIGSLLGTAPVHRSLEDVTIFDSSGLAIQDLFVARAALEAARAANLVQIVEL